MTIAFSVALTALAVILAFTVKANLRMQKDLERADTEVFVAQSELDKLRFQYEQVVKEKAWLDGVQAGRKTDTLFQKILKQYTNGEQFTVMMNGEVTKYEDE